MPIRPENKAKYPADWKKISLRIREQAGNACQFCRISNGIVVVRTGDTWREICGQEWDIVHSKIRYSNHSMVSALKALGFTRINERAARDQISLF